MPDTYTVTVPMHIARTTLDDILTNALYACWGWWGRCTHAPGEGAYNIQELDDIGEVVATHPFTLDSIARACASIISGEVPLRPDLAKQVRSAVSDDPDIDADAADCVLQLAVFGEVRYG